MHTNTYTHAHAYTYIHACLYTCIHTHIHTHTCNMYICTHTSTPGTTALQQIARRADADAGSSARLFHSTQSTIFSTFNARTSLYPHPETPIPLNPPPPLPNIPQNSSQTADAQFYCSTLINTTECMTLKKLPAQLHNGPLHSCRKIRGRAAVQQSLSRRARRTPSPRMTKVIVHKERKVNEEHPNSAAAHHSIMTARRPDNTRSSAALVPGQSTHFMTSPSRWPQRRSPETRLHFCHFRGLLQIPRLYHPR